MNAPSSCFCAGVKSSARVGGANEAAAAASAAARLRAAVSFMQISQLRRRAMARSPPVAVQETANCGVFLLTDFRDRVFPRQRTEPGHLGVELQFDRAGGAMPLLADDHLGPAVRALHLAHPGDVLLGAGPRLLVLEIIFLAEDEQHHVGVLLDLPGFAQV